MLFGLQEVALPSISEAKHAWIMLPTRFKFKVSDGSVGTSKARAGTCLGDSAVAFG
jgi:hypothetical protein